MLPPLAYARDAGRRHFAFGKMLLSSNKSVGVSALIKIWRFHLSGEEGRQLSPIGVSVNVNQY